MVSAVLVWVLLLSILPFIKAYMNTGETQDQTSTRANTLSDDADDIQKQLDNEARDRIQFGRPKTIWVFHLPSQFPELSTEAMWRYPVSNIPELVTFHLMNIKRCAEHNMSSRNPHSVSAAGGKDWEYSGQNKWAVIYPECGRKSQSPIDLPTKGLINARPGRQLVFSHYDAMPESLSLRDDGKRLTLYGSWKPGLRPLVYGGAAHSRRYLFNSLTLHWPSEHYVGGFQYPMESQLIHISAEYRNLAEAIEASARDPLAILGIANLYMFGNRTEPCIKELLKASAAISIGSKSVTRRPLSDFSPPFKEYVTYQGSLTAPPCTESVLWMVRARSLVITRDTVALANKLLTPGGEPRRMLIRQLQSRNDRKIFFFI